MSTLLEKTLELARSSKVPVTQTCRAAKLTTRWYYKLLSGEIPDPGVRRIQRLHDYLALRAGQQKGEAA
jgi:hypothetical protein